MRDLRRRIRLGTLAAAICGAIILACVDVTAPGGGGVLSDPRRCESGRTSAWAQNGLTMNVTAPPCPFPVRDEYTYVDYIAIISAPSGKILFNSYGHVNSYINAMALDWYSASSIAAAYFVYFQQHPGDPGTYRAEPRMTGRPQTYRVPGNSSQMLDSLHADAIFMAHGGFSQAWKILPGNITNVAPSLLGPGFVLTGASGSWRSRTHWDTTAYSFRWLLDGQEIPNATSARYAATFNTSGTYTLSTVAIRADNTSDTVARTITVGSPLPVYISGPTQIQPGATCTWDAVTSGGSPPLNYSWTNHGAPAGNDYFYTGSKPRGLGGSSFQLKVAVTDAVGAPGEHEITVYESSSAPLCAF